MKIGSICIACLVVIACINPSLIIERGIEAPLLVLGALLILMVRSIIKNR